MNGGGAIGSTFLALTIIIVGIVLTVTGFRRRGPILIAALKP